MTLTKLIEQFQKLSDESGNTHFKKTITRIINLLKEIDNKKLADQEKVKIQTSISPYLENIQTEKDVKISLKNL